MQLNWNKSDGLIPAIVQDQETQKVLMLGYMNEEALRITQETGLVTFFSRSRQSIWVKGETSGNQLQLVSIQPDCDQDTLLIRAKPKGPTCHRETQTCFDSDFEFLSELQATIESRFLEPTQKSYVSQLIESGLDRISQKVGEEAIETVIASKNNDLKEFQGEAADLLFHLMVLLRYKNSSLSQVVGLLRERHARRSSG